MAAQLIIEDGTVVLGANSYCDLAFANQFFSNRFQDHSRLASEKVSNGVDDQEVLWVGGDAAKVGALIRATDHIDAVYGAHFMGKVISDTQSLAFPRDMFSGIPIALKKATCLFAVHGLNGTLIPVASSNDSTEVIKGDVIRRKEKVGAIEEETEFAHGKTGNNIIYYHEVLTPKSYPEADMMLKSLLVPDVQISPSHGNIPTSGCPTGEFGTGSTWR